MSGLARVLARRQSPGVYHWTSAAAVPDLRHAVEKAEWRFFHLDTVAVDDKAGLLASCAEAFDFPAWFGHNFDALADALSDVRVGDHNGVLVLWDGWATLARASRRTFDVAVNVFDSRADDDRGGPFVVLLRGAGPDDTGVVDLDAHSAES